MKLMTPQEIEVWYLLPAIRREFAKLMVARGLNQKEVAKKLYLTEPAISQYLKDKRASEVSFHDAIKKEIKHSVDRILKDSGPQIVVYELQRVLKLMKQSMVLCEMHKKLDPAIPADCAECIKLW